MALRKHTQTYQLRYALCAAAAGRAGDGGGRHSSLFCWWWPLQAKANQLYTLQLYYKAPDIPSNHGHRAALPNSTSSSSARAREPHTWRRSPRAAATAAAAGRQPHHLAEGT